MGVAGAESANEECQAGTGAKLRGAADSHQTSLVSNTSTDLSATSPALSEAGNDISRRWKRTHAD